jgi:hypothetical protein
MCNSNAIGGKRSAGVYCAATCTPFTCKRNGDMSDISSSPSRKQGQLIFNLQNSSTHFFHSPQKLLILYTMNHCETLISQRNLLRLQGKSEFVYNKSHFTFIRQMNVSQQHESSFKNYINIINILSISNHKLLTEMY